jgi:hypothetical protein
MSAESKKAAVNKPARGSRGGPRVEGGSREARKLAMLVLEVLGGGRTPSDAAAALGVSVVRYYVLEARALSGLVKGCEPRSRGPGRSNTLQVTQLQRKVEQLERECSRRQSLLRLSQRALGLLPSQPAKKSGKRRPKKPTVRALRAAAELGLRELERSDGIAASTS